MLTYENSLHSVKGLLKAPENVHGEVFDMPYIKDEGM